MSGEPRTPDVIEARGPVRCRIPQRMTSFRPRQPITTNVGTARSRGSNNFENAYSRPNSANKRKEPGCVQMRQGKNSDRVPQQPKKLPQMRRQMDSGLPNKARPFIRIPTQQRAVLARSFSNNKAFLPDQDVIQQRENETSDCSPGYNEEAESMSSRSEKLMQLKITWQEKVIAFEKMKNDLRERQNNILELYAIMRDTQEKMSSLGESSSLPTVEDLRIMNVTKMSPEQLLQLCAGDDRNNARDKLKKDGKIPLAIDLNKLYDMPCKLVDTCEQTLEKRKEVIDWFKTLTSTEKGISVHVLSKKINEFNAENEMLRSTFEQVKVDFHNDLENIVSLMRKSVNETMSLHLRMEELTYEISELNSQNADLEKKIHNTDQLRSHSNRTRIEELEKELKEEKTKKVFLRERLSRTEGQVKMNVERATQLEAALEQARSQTWSLERTVQQLHEQNQKLQNDFDNELKKLTESIKEHTVHLEEIAEAREKLKIEKEDLEKRIAELSSYYNESLHNVKQEMQVKVAKIMETEKKYETEHEERTKLEEKLEALSHQLKDAELRLTDALKLIKEMHSQLNKAAEVEKELDDTKKELEKAIKDINNNKSEMKKQSEQLDEIDRSFQQAIELEKSLKREICSKEEYINELERKQSLLERQLKENENKMESYVEQLSSLKTHIKQLQEDFGEFENLNELHDMVNQQRAKLQEATHQNSELDEALQKKEEELEACRVSLSDHEQQVEEKLEIIKILSEKEEEQTNIIKILRNNLELRSHADNELSQQVAEKNSEIESLIINIETKKQQISNLEKIILTLEDQTRKASVQKKRDQEHIKMLQNKIIEFEAFREEASRSIETPAENLDSLIKILEDELRTSTDHELKPRDHTTYSVTKKKLTPDQLHEKLECRADENNSFLCHSEPDASPMKVTMGNCMKKNYLPCHEEQYNGDSLDRKKAITKMDTLKWSPITEPSINLYPSPQPHLPPTKDNMHLRRLIPTVPPSKPPAHTRNLQFLSPDQLRDDKQFKMFKWAGHRL